MIKLPTSKLNVKMIALDLDDTLLNGSTEISEENVEALREAAEQGIYVVLCSGRAEEGILPYVRKLDIAGCEAGRYLIAINGSSVFDLHTRVQIHSCKVLGDVLQHANEEAKKVGLFGEVYTPTTIYMPASTKWTDLDVKLCKLKGEVVKDFDSFIKQGFSKMLIPGEPEVLQELQKKLRSDFGDKAVVFISKPYFLEIMPPNCGKGEALLWLANHIGISAEQTMGFGDSMNDESMIRMAKYGVAMCNGLKEIQDVANFVTEKDNNNSGVGDFIKKYVL